MTECVRRRIAAMPTLPKTAAIVGVMGNVVCAARYHDPELTMGSIPAAIADDDAVELWSRTGMLLSRPCENGGRSRSQSCRKTRRSAGLTACKSI